MQTRRMSSQEILLFDFPPGSRISVSCSSVRGYDFVRRHRDTRYLLRKVDLDRSRRTRFQTCHRRLAPCHNLPVISLWDVLQSSRTGSLGISFLWVRPRLSLYCLWRPNGQRPAWEFASTPMITVRKTEVIFEACRRRRHRTAARRRGPGAGHRHRRIVRTMNRRLPPSANRLPRSRLRGRRSQR
jgi:hypothetical protein